MLGQRKKAAANVRRPRKTRSRNRPVQGATRNARVLARPSPSMSVWLNRALILCGVCMVGAAATQAYLSLKVLPVQRITVTGELEHTQAQVVQDIVQPGLAGGFLSADLQQIRRQLEGLPWIYEASVRRRWPAALEINVVEERPIARWGSDGFLNHEGGVFRSGKLGDWSALPRLSGPVGSAPALMAKYQRLIEMLSPLGLSVEALTIDARGQVEAMLDGGMQLVLGQDDFLNRLHRFVLVYNRELQGRRPDIERVDLRYANGIAVAFRSTPPVAGL
ncbi:MAG: FtsQ-type POTRA domain-containing protein [Halioglobus sp.]|nr:FtsQ-type POTRA domain-containing protein [Halioglobus sp.]